MNHRAVGMEIFYELAAVRPLDEQNLLVRVDVAVSPQFYGWLAGLGNKLSIVSPEEVKEDYCNYLKDIIEAM